MQQRSQAVVMACFAAALSILAGAIPVRVTAQESQNPFQPLADSLNQTCASAQRLGLARCGSDIVPDIRGKWSGGSDLKSFPFSISSEFTVMNEDQSGNFSGNGLGKASDGSYAYSSYSGLITSGKIQIDSTITKSYIAPGSKITSWCGSTTNGTVTSDGNHIHGSLSASCNSGNVDYTRTERYVPEDQPPGKKLEFGDVLSEQFLKASVEGRKSAQ